MVTIHLQLPYQDSTSPFGLPSIINNSMINDDETLLPLIEIVHNTETYQDRLRSTNVREFTLDKIITKKKIQEFVRDTTLDPK